MHNKMHHYSSEIRRRMPTGVATFKLWAILCMLLSAVQYPKAVRATDDVANVSPCELESIINQLVYPSPEYQLHASALRQQLKNILRDRQLAVGEEQSLDDYDYPEEDKRSVASLAAQGLLRPGVKRGLATLAKNGQLPTQDPENTDAGTEGGRSESKRYIGSLARSGGFMGYGKRNIGSLARDFQLPQNGKRNLATLARLGLLRNEPKRNVAHVARYNSNRYGATPSSSAVDKRNLGALRGSPVHGGFQHVKRDDEDILIPATASLGAAPSEMDYVDMMPSYYMYPSYADLDWGDFGRAQKRFLDTSKDPELFGIENATPTLQSQQQLQYVFENADALDEDLNHEDEQDSDTLDDLTPQISSQHINLQAQPQKRHIGSVYRSGFLPSYRALRSTTGSGGGFGGGGRFSRSGRARQFVEYYHQREPLRQPIAAVCKRCFLPYRPIVHWSAGAAGVRGRLQPIRYIADDETATSIHSNSLPTARASALRSYGRRPVAYASTSSLSSSSPSPLSSSAAASRTIGAVKHSWGTPPRITALHRRNFRRSNDLDNNYPY